MKKHIAPSILAITASLLILLSSCSANSGQTTPQNDSTMCRILERGVLKVGTTGDYRPLSFRQTDGTYWGFDIELAELIAGKIGVGIEFVPTSWPTLTADVMSSQPAFDLAIGGITITSQRKETMLMSNGYLANGKTILCRASDSQRYQSLNDLNKPEVRVMVNPGGTNELFAKEHLQDATLIIHQRNEEIPSLIASGKADVMITEVTEAPYYITTDTLLSAPLLDTPFTHSFIGALMPKGQDGLLEVVNGILEELRTDGTLHKLHDKYHLKYLLDDEKKSTGL